MAAAAGKSFAARWGVHVVVLFIVVVWTIPTLGILVSSLRDRDQIAASGWWTALTTSAQTGQGRTDGAEAQTERDGRFVISGNLLADEGAGRITAFGTRIQNPTEHEAGAVADLGDGVTLRVDADGSYEHSSPVAFEGRRGQRVFFEASTPPRFTTENYETVLFSEGIGRSFINSLTVTIPATIIPILIAAFAAYALAWMRFPGRGLLVAIIVGLLVVPLQMSLIPMLRLYNGVANIFDTGAQGYFGVWLAHTAFGLPLAIFLLRNYMVGLPREIMESARMDGATHFQIFTTMVLPLSFPALASFAIFQFLWVWNDLLVALIFLGSQNDQLVLTGRLVNLLGTRGNNWELLTAGAFVSMVVPLIVFFSLQRYFVRGLLAGSVK